MGEQKGLRDSASLEGVVGREGRQVGDAWLEGRLEIAARRGGRSVGSNTRF